MGAAVADRHDELRHLRVEDGDRLVEVDDGVGDDHRHRQGSRSSDFQDRAARQAAGLDQFLQPCLGVAADLIVLGGVPNPTVMVSPATSILYVPAMVGLLSFQGVIGCAQHMAS